MENDGKYILRILKRLNGELSRLDTTEVSLFASDFDKFCSARSERKAAAPSLQNKEFFALDNSALIERLRKASSRSDGIQTLSDARLTRKELVDLARKADVHVVKEDRIDTIEEKLIENLVGARLNSIAIRGE